MSEEKNFWTTLPGIITGLAAVVTAVTGLVVALNGAGVFSKPTGGNKAPAKKDIVVKKDADSLPGKQAEQQTVVKKVKPVFALTAVKIEDHDYKILGSSLEAITPETNLLKIKINYKNNSNYSPATFWNEGFRLSIDGSLTAPSGDLSELVARHAEQVGTITFEVPNSVKDIALHILDVEKDISIPIKLVTN
ncbi:hypothetical protein [Mucilaginibacter sp.]|uniref:hypothetical protein n=1 Tax=Mucilaginibacter sp. TaxID=1882438 RepID=UPI00326586EA